MTTQLTDHIRAFKNRDGIMIYFVSTAPTYVFMTNYLSIGITGDERSPMAVDPSGGPFIERGSDISQYTGRETKQLVREITLTTHGVIFFTT